MVRKFNPGDVVYSSSKKYRGVYSIREIYQHQDHGKIVVLDDVDGSKEVHLTSIGMYAAGMEKAIDGHRPVCSECGDVWPCRHVSDLESIDHMLIEVEHEEMKRKKRREQRRKYRARYSTPMVCPACQQPVTTGQPKETFHVNAVIKGGPPVTFHQNAKCGAEGAHCIIAYKQRLRKLKHKSN